MGFWGAPIEDGQNRFIPKEDHDFYRVATLRVTFTDDNGFCLVDDGGFLVTLYELTEILTAIKPFYDDVPDRDITHYNDQHFRSQRDSKVVSKPKRTVGPGNYVYVLKAGPYYKIGVSSNVDKRIKQLSALPPFDLELVCLLQPDDMYTLERELHIRFAEKRKRGEWFTLDDTDVEWIKGHAQETKQRGTNKKRQADPKYVPASQCLCRLAGLLSHA